ncbi:MAG: FG-GAP repeat domain-containing protein, partial [Pseudomonadales bacterium]
MKKILLSAIIFASPVKATPLFQDLSNNLPHHTYAGDWNHFVGGGVAIMDCNGDSLPDIFASGGDEPAMLLLNQGDFKFQEYDLPNILGSTGAYPIDINGDGHMDLFVLRLGKNIVLKGSEDCNFTDAT